MPTLPKLSPKYMHWLKMASRRCSTEGEAKSVANVFKNASTFSKIHEYRMEESFDWNEGMPE